MYKNSKLHFSVLLIISVIFLSFILKDKVKLDSSVFVDIADNVNLILDSRDFNTLPKNFRKSTDLINTKNYKDLDLTGLDKLNISGSSQFSEYNFPLMINKLGTSLPTTIIDLRQESHGFIFIVSMV